MLNIILFLALFVFQYSCFQAHLTFFLYLNAFGITAVFAFPYINSSETVVCEPTT